MSNRPVAFGYKMSWLVLPPTSVVKLSSFFELQDCKSATWIEGVNFAYKEKIGIFITPVVGKWTFVLMGYGAPVMSEKQNTMRKFENFIKKTSAKFGQVQYFGTHRIIEYQSWAKASTGSIERLYGYLGERGEILANFGTPTPSELELGWQENIDEDWYPNEEFVMNLAEKWSVNPQSLEDLPDGSYEVGLGLVGRTQFGE